MKIIWDKVGGGLAIKSAKTRDSVGVSSARDLKNVTVHVYKNRQRRDVRANVATFLRVTIPTSRHSREWKFQRHDVTKGYFFHFSLTLRR